MRDELVLDVAEDVARPERQHRASPGDRIPRADHLGQGGPRSGDVAEVEERAAPSQEQLRSAACAGSADRVRSSTATASSYAHCARA
jgi:hypothetical protein